MICPVPEGGVTRPRPGSAAELALIWSLVASTYLAGCAVVGWWQGLPLPRVRIPRKGAPLGLLWRRPTPDLAPKIIRAELAGALAVQLWRPIRVSILRPAVADEYVAALLLGITSSADEAATLARDLEREARALTRHLEPTIDGVALFLSCWRCIGMREGRDLLPFFLRLYGTAKVKSPLDLPSALAVRTRAG
jgi:hypothetical protein